MDMDVISALKAQGLGVTYNKIARKNGSHDMIAVWSPVFPSNFNERLSKGPFDSHIVQILFHKGTNCSKMPSTSKPIFPAHGYSRS